jgi:phospholipase C
MHLPLRRASVIGVSVALAVGGGAAAATAASAHSAPKPDPAVHFTLAHRTTTPIKHVVVIYQENVSYDHYFGTYPKAANTSGQTFTAPTG